VRYRRRLIALGVLLLVVSLPATAFAWTGWPWEPLRLWLALVTIVAVRAWPLRAAVLAVVAWAAVAAPLTVRSGRAGKVDLGDATVLTRGVPSGPHRVELGPIPLGPVWMRTPDKAYISGESDDSDLDVVAWSVTWLPWPHVERDLVLGIFDEDAEDTIVARDGHRMIVRAGRETRSVVFGLSTSWLTWLGWIGVLLAVRRRRRQARRLPSSAA
jgi:hypothetical protein